VDLRELARTQQELAQEEVVEVLREFRRPGCSSTRLAMALSIIDLRRSLQALQAELLALRAQQGAGGSR
jgi:hypothetical protein